MDDFRHNFISGLTYPGDDLDFTQITAHAHATHPTDGEVQAWFSRGNQHINFGDASTHANINNFAREEQVIYHEYSHAIIYDIESEISSAEGGEEGAISEGVPDYFSGAHAGDALSGEYVFENFPQAQRDMANPDIGDYDQYLDESPGAHRGGEFFSAILWDLRGSMSASAVDFLVYDALHGVTGNPTFLEFRDAMMAADNPAYGGAHRDDIQDTFADWGVGNYSPLDVSISGPTELAVGEEGAWTAGASGGDDGYSYQWYFRWGLNGQWVDANNTTDTYSQTMIDAGGYLGLKVEVTSGPKDGFAVLNVHCSDCGPDPCPECPKFSFDD